LKVGDIINESTIGALLYSDKSNLLKQDSDYLYYNDKKKYLSIGHDNPTSNLDIAGPRKQIRIQSNAPKDQETSIEFGIYGQEARWILGASGPDLDTFYLKDLKTGKTWRLNSEKTK
jgi:hypothetical protein